MSLLLNVVSQASGIWSHRSLCPTNTTTVIKYKHINSDSTLSEPDQTLWRMEGLNIRSTSSM